MRSFTAILNRNKSFLWTAALLLFGSSVLGYMFHDQVKPLVDEALKQLADIAQSLQSNPSYMNTFFTIFWNNLRATFIMLVTGFLFGIFPAFSLLLNGFMLGFVLHDAAAQYDVHPFALFVSQILPHGVLEFPAIIIAAGFGLKFGWLTLRGIGSIFSEQVRVSVGKQFREAFRQLPLVFLGIVVLLVLAAAIEAGLITLAQSQLE